MKFAPVRIAILSSVVTMLAADGALTRCCAQPLHTISEAAAQDNGAPANPVGKWRLSFSDPKGNPRQGALALQQDGSNLSGTYTGPRGTFSTTGTMQGTQIKFTIKGLGKKLSFTGNVDGDKMNGTTDARGSWSATRDNFSRIPRVLPPIWFGPASLPPAVLKWRVDNSTPGFP